MRRFLRISAWLLVAIVIMAVALFTYLRSADLSVYEEQIESFVSDAIGHEFQVDGRFELQFGEITRLVAEDVSLTNPDWPTDSELIRVGHLTLAVDLWSLFAEPLVVEVLEANDIQGRVERQADGRNNWQSARAPEDSAEEFDTDRVAFRRVRLDGIDVSYVDPGRRRPLDIAIESLTVAPDANDLLDLDVQGGINDLPLWADGKLGPWQNFLDGKDITADLDLTLGSVRLSIQGSADDLPYLDGIMAEASLTGPDVGSVIDRLGLPPFADGAFEIDARISKLDRGHQVRADGNLGAIDIFASGSIDRFIATQRAELDFSISGPDTQYVAELFGVAGAPASPFRIAGDLALAGRQASFSDTRVVVGPNSITLNGRLHFVAAIPDGQLSIVAEGPDFAALGPFLDIEGLPPEAFDISGELLKQGNRWQAQGLVAQVGANRVTANGSLTVGRRQDNEIVFSAEGPDISVLQDFTDLRGIPAKPFQVTARLKSDPGGVAVQEGSGVFGDNRVEVAGVISDQPGLAGTLLRVRAEGPELQHVALLTGVPHLPAGAFDIRAEIRLDREFLIFDRAEARVGELTAAGSGQAGLGNRAGFFDVDLDLQGADATQFVTLDSLQPFAGEAFAIAGGIRRAAENLELTDVRAEIGEYRLTADGTLSLSPLSNDSDVRFSLAGPSLNRIGQMFGSDLLVDKGFDVAGQFTGAPGGFEMRDFDANVGKNDARGVFTVDLREKPRVSGKLTSTFLDLSERLKSLVAAEEETEGRQAEKAGMLFSDEPIDADRLQAADIDIEVRVGRLRTNTIDVTNFQIGVRLLDGELHIDPISMNEGAGSVTGSLSLTPVESGYEFRAMLAAEQMHLGMAVTEDHERAKLPPLGGKIELRGTGASVHQIMASSNGTIDLRQGSGEAKEFFAAALFSDVFLEALRTINPMRKKETARKLDCGIYEINIEDGLATLQQVVMQTDRLMLVVTGDIDLEKEKLNLNFRAKPREGLGVSLGAVANSFLGVRGTLVSPKITIDPKTSVTATGAAVATGGLSLLARGLWDRLSASQDICKEPADP